ncbi:hypothetical protein ACX818_001314 [Acinetobacter baumannii]
MFDAGPCIVGMFIGIFLMIDGALDIKYVHKDLLKVILGILLFSFGSISLWLS